MVLEKVAPENPLDVLNLVQPRDSFRSRIVRRAIDVIGAATGLLLLSPVLGAAAIAIKTEDGGPVIHRRRVLGLGGREFHALKLRTMRPDADAWLAARPELKREYERNIKLSNDPRVTRVGHWLRRTSVDELPQLWNVVRGQMSLVGPRMIHPSESDRYRDFLPQRLSVKPGLTGLWQISGRQNVDYEARVALDREYLARRSLVLDLTILLKTLPAVLKKEGAH